MGVNLLRGRDHCRARARRVHLKCTSNRKKYLVWVMGGVVREHRDRIGLLEF